MIEILTENLAAGELKTFMVQGEYLEILEAQYPLDVFMMDRSGGQISTMRQAEASFFSRPGKFEVFQVQSANAQRVRLFVGSGDAGTRRTAGVVQVVDGEKARTLAGGMFSGSPAIGGTAGQYQRIQLWNPANSGKNLIVSQLSLNCAAGANPILLWKSVALSAVYGSAAANKRSGGAAPAAELRIESNAAAEALASIILNTGNGTLSWPIKGALVVTPGYGLTCFNNTLAGGCGMNVEWFEETI